MLPGMWLGDPRCSGCATPMPYRRRHLARHGLACRRCLRARPSCVLPTRAQLSQGRRHRHRDHGPVRPRHRHRNGRPGRPRPLRVADQSWRARRRGGHRCARSQGQGPGGAPTWVDIADTITGLLSGRSVAGYGIGYDQAVIDAEMRRVGRAPVRCQWLDVLPTLSWLRWDTDHPCSATAPPQGAAPTAGRPTSSRWRLPAPCSAAE